MTKFKSFGMKSKFLFKNNKSKVRDRNIEDISELSTSKLSRNNLKKQQLISFGIFVGISNIELLP